MNKYILDFDLLKENNLSIGEFKILIELYENIYNPTIVDKYIEHKGFIKIVDNNTILREKGRLLIESCIYKQNNNININPKQISKVVKSSEFDNFVVEYRLLWKGLKQGSMGSINSCRDKLKRFLKENPDYTQEDIIKAAKTYINSLDDYKYLQQADYFIYKKDKFGEQSRLLAFIDEDEVKESGWTSKLK